jgi:hypothetical protein
MATLTLAQLLGKPGYGDTWDMDRQIEIGKKSTAGGSAIAKGRIVFLTEGTGLWAIATAGSTGRMGVVPALAPVNVDADPTLNVVSGPGAEIYVEANAAIKPGADVGPDTGGKAKNVFGGPFSYVGHYGEGSGHGQPATDAAQGDPIRIRKKIG